LTPNLARSSALEAVVSEQCASTNDAALPRHVVTAFVPDSKEIWTRGPHHPNGATITLERPITGVVSGPCAAPIIVLHVKGYTSIRGATAQLATDDLPVLGVVHSLATETDGGAHSLTWLALQDLFGKDHQVHMLRGGDDPSAQLERFMLDGAPVALGTVGSDAYTVIDTLDGNFVLLKEGSPPVRVSEFDRVGRCTERDLRRGDAGQTDAGATLCPL
jgi:hypothetical protein